MPRVAGYLVTDADLNGIYPPKAGYTPTGDNSKILSGAEINARYTVNGAPSDQRCPSWDMLSAAVTTAQVHWEMSLMSASQSTNYMLAVVGGSTYIDSRSGPLNGTVEVAAGTGTVTLTKQGPIPYCTLEIYDTTGGGRVLVTSGATAGAYTFNPAAGKTYDIVGYIGTGIPLDPTGQPAKRKQKTKNNG